MKKNRVLIISNFFAPDNVIGAIRMTKIGKYLSKDYNCEVDVITANNNLGIDQLLQSDRQYFHNIETFDKPKSILEWVQETKKKNTQIEINKKNDSSATITASTSSIQGIKEVVKYFLLVSDEYRYYKRVIKNSSCFNNREKKYDFVISTYNTFSGHWIASAIKKKGISDYWIADFRDPVLSEYTPSIFKVFAKRYTRHVLLSSDAVVTVANGLIQKFNDLVPLKDKISVISNGFDEDDYSLEISREKSDKLIMTYAGALYDGRRDFSVLFEIIRDLINSNEIKASELEIDYVGNAFDVLLKQAQKYCLDSLLVNKGYVPREKSIEIQNHSDVLLLATWNTLSSQGVLTGKLFEYMMLKKPIICIVNGDLGNSDLKTIIDSARLGYCYEQANQEKDRVLLREYLLELYHQKQTDSILQSFKPNDAIVNRFNYRSIAEQFFLLGNHDSN